MDIFETFATDEKLEVEGAWFPLSKTVKVLVARSGNENYIDTLRRKLDASGIDLTSKAKEDEDAAEAVFIDVMAETLLLGWQGITSKGEPVAYSKDAARAYLAVKDFRKKVVAFSETFEAFRVKAEKQLGNG